MMRKKATHHPFPHCVKAYDQWHKRSEDCHTTSFFGFHCSGPSLHKFHFTATKQKIKVSTLKRSAPHFSIAKIVMLAGMLIAASQTLKGAIVLSDDFETGRFNLNDPGTPLDGRWFTTQASPGAIPNWIAGGSQNVIGTDSYSSPDGVYIPTHTPGGHIAASFFSGSNDGSVNTASLERSVVTDGSHGGIYTIHFWISNPVADPNARQNLFSLTWGTTPLDLTFDTRFKTPNPDPLAFELQGGSNEYVLNSNTNWFEVTISGLTASTSSTVLKFTAQNNNSATLVDDVTVEETPEPSTVVLLGAGAAFMGMRRRRRAIA